MDEIWERAVEAALDGQTDRLATRTLTLDGAVKCFQGRLPPPQLLERFRNLQHLSIANVGVSSLEQFPRLGNLQKLVLSDNRIAGCLEFLVEAGLDSLRDLDLSNNRIQFVDDLAPLAQLKLMSLDLYECPVTRVKDYRSMVFGLIKSLKYLDKTDAEGNERPESDDEEDEEDEEDEGEDEGDEEDPGSGEVDAEERTGVHGMSNGRGDRLDAVVDVDEDEESDAEDEESQQLRGVNDTSHRPHGFRFQPVNGGEGQDDGDNSESGEEIDEEEGEEDDDDDDDDVVEVHEIEDSDNEEDGVDDEENEADDEDEEEVDNEDGDLGGPESTGRVMGTEGEIDGHEQGEDDEDGDGETGEEEQGVEDDGGFGDEDEGEEDEVRFMLLRILLSLLEYLDLCHLCICLKSIQLFMLVPEDKCLIRQLKFSQGQRACL